MVGSSFFNLMSLRTDYRSWGHQGCGFFMETDVCQPLGRASGSRPE